MANYSCNVVVRMKEIHSRMPHLVYINKLQVRRVAVETSPVNKFSFSAEVYARLYSRYQLLTMPAVGSRDSKQWGKMLPVATPRAMQGHG